MQADSGCCSQEYFVSPEHATLRLLVGSPGAGEFCEFLGSAAQLGDFSGHLQAHAFEDPDAEGFAPALPGAGLQLPNDSAPAWRRVLAELHHTPIASIKGAVASPPLELEGIRVLCICAPSATDVRIFAGSGDRQGNSDCQRWEFLCSAAALRRKSAYFDAALRTSAWLEGRTREVRFESEDPDVWRLALTYLHDAEPGAGLVPQLDVRCIVGLLLLCQKYFLSGLEVEAFRALRDGHDVPAQLAALRTEEFCQVASELARCGALSALLGTWCLAGGRRMVAHLAALLLAGGELARGVLASKGALAFLASEAFLGAHKELGFGEPLAVLAKSGNLELLYQCSTWGWLQGPGDLQHLLNDESLLPLVQIPGIKKELRHPRFCDASLVDSLEPFPQLFEDLLKAWFKESSQTRVAPPELAAWASCERFQRSGYLCTYLASVCPEELGRFAQLAKLEDPPVAQAVQLHVNGLAKRAYAGLPQWPTSIAAILADRSLLRRLWMYRVVGARELARLAGLMVLPALLGPLRAFAAARMLLTELQLNGNLSVLVRTRLHGCPTSPWLYDLGPTTPLIRVFGTFFRLWAAEMQGMGAAAASLLSLARLAIGSAWPRKSVTDVRPAAAC